jgi:6-phosphogluconolactonase
MLLGMGEDGHVASLFPEDPISQELLEGSKIGLFNTNSPKSPNKRITCSHTMLLKAAHKFLMIIGKEKFSLLTDSRKNTLPIDHFTKEIDNLVTYYSENEF